MPGRPRSPLAMVVLAMLREQPMHAYRIHELINERGKNAIVNVAQRNSVYQAIDQLVRAGLIGVRATSRDEGRPERVAYELTQDGQQALEEWLTASLSVPAREFPQFPAGLAFIMLVPPKQAIAALKRRAQTLERQLEADTATLTQVRKSGLPRLFLVDDEYRLAMARAELAWVRALLADLRAKKITWSEKYLREIAARFSAPPGER